MNIEFPKNEEFLNKANAFYSKKLEEDKEKLNKEHEEFIDNSFKESLENAKTSIEEARNRFLNNLKDVTKVKIPILREKILESAITSFNLIFNVQFHHLYTYKKNKEQVDQMKKEIEEWRDQQIQNAKS